MQLTSNLRIPVSFDVADHACPLEYKRKHNNGYCQNWLPTEQWAFRGVDPSDQRQVSIAG